MRPPEGSRAGVDGAATRGCRCAGALDRRSVIRRVVIGEEAVDHYSSSGATEQFRRRRVSGGWQSSLEGAWEQELLRHRGNSQNHHSFGVVVQEIKQRHIQNKYVEVSNFLRVT
jgi:hypothetical protein